MDYRSTASFGKRQEFVVIGELLKNGYDVYLTLVDDQGIDCIIRLNENRYLDIQIKARSKDAKLWNAFGLFDFKHRDNYYFIFYTEKNNTYWVMPSSDVRENSYITKNGKHQGKLSMVFPKSEKSRNYKEFQKYKNDFSLLK